MKGLANKLIFISLSTLVIACSSDNIDADEVLIFENLEATVNGPISCQTMENSFVQEIEFDEPTSFGSGANLKSIGITNLPENMRAEGLRILISVRQTEFPDGACVALFSPEYFFENTEVSSNP